MEKAGTPSNRLTRSSARNTPSRKMEDSPDINAAEELKSNLRKSRRKTETNLRTNGDTAADVDTRKSRNYEEISDCNSMDSMDSNKSSKPKGSPKQKNHKTQSPTISRKSLRSRRSITPGPETESNVARKIRRSTSESKLDSVGTLTRRSARAKSESKDFTFTPSKQCSNDTEQSHSESNSKCIPVNSALRVIDEIIEEDNELASPESPKTSPCKVSNEETVNTDCVSILVDTNHENNENVILDKNKLEKNSSEGSMSQNEITQSNCLKVTHTSYIDENQELQEKVADMTLGDNTEQKSDQLPIVEISTLAKTSNELAALEKIEAKKDLMNQEVCLQKDINKPFSLSENAGPLNKLSDQLSVAKDVESAKEPRFHLSISEEAENLKIINILSLNEKNHDTFSDDKQTKTSLEEIGTKHDCAEQNATSFQGSKNSQNLELCESDTSLNTESLLQNNETNILNKSELDIDKESSNLHPVKTICEDSKSMIEPSTVKLLQFEISASGSENISITENNNVSLIPEGQSENDNLEVGQDSTEIINNVSLCSSPHNDLIPLDSKVSQEDNIEDNDTVVICGSDSEEPDDVKENNVFTETVTGVDNEEVTQRGSTDLKQVDENTSQKCDEQVTDTEVYENNSNMIESLENIEEQNIIPEDKDAVVTEEIEDLNKSDINESPVKNGTELLQINGNTFEQMEYTKVSITASEQLNNSELEMPVSEEIVDKPRKLLDLEEEDNKITQKQLPTEHPNENRSNVLNTDKESDEQFQENNEFDPLEDEEALSRDSASDSELYKDMSDFGSDVDGKKDGSQYGDSASTELKSGDSEEYASSFEGEEDEDINNEDNLLSNKKVTVENIQKKIDPKVAEKLLDTASPMTYDKALAILNQNRVDDDKIDDEQFFDMFTEELNRVSEKSGSDSDIAIVDEYIAEPEEQKHQKSNKNLGKPHASLKNRQQSAPSNSVQNRSVPHEQVPKQIQINLKTCNKSDLPSTSLSQPFTGTYNKQVPTEHNHQGIHLSKGGLYEVIYDQFAPPNMQDTRIHPHHTSHDNFSVGGMFIQPLGQVPDAQMPYSSGSLKVRSIDSICGAHQSNMMNLNSTNIDRPVPINNIINPSNDTVNMMMPGVSTATMTEVNYPLHQGVSFSPSYKQAGSVTNPILEILGLDKKRLKMLKKVLGLNESRVKQRNKIKQLLMKEALKIGLNLKTLANIENLVNREQRNSSDPKMKARKRQLITKLDDSDSSFINHLVRSCSAHSSEELDTHSEETSSSISRKDESSNESSADGRKINLEDGGVSVTIDTRQRKKQRHRAQQKAPKKKASWNMVNIGTTNEKKRRYQSSESSDGENIKHTKKKKQTESLMLIRPKGRERKSRHRGKMTQGKRQTKEKSSVLQSKSGTFTVDPVTATSQSESDTFSQDETSNYLEKLKDDIKKELAEGRNKLSNMFTQHSLREKKKNIKRKVDKAFELSGQETKSKRLPAELLAKLGNEEKKTKKRKKDQSADSESDEHLDYKNRKPRKRHLSRKLNVPSVAVNKEYIPLPMPGPTQFGLKRLDKDGTLTAVEKAAKFRSDRLYGAAVKRITSQELLNVKKKQHRNDLVLEKQKKKRGE